jgi:3-phenylpropionate/trans-cinnamate dioxygenase ferredoxin reductase subunit
MSDRVVIVGGGLAGQRCAEALRRHGHAGEIVLVCAERHRPYDRPPLSKRALREPQPKDALCFRPPGWYTENSVELSLGVAAGGLDEHGRTIALSNGSSLSYGRLLIATGARPRRLAILDGFENVSVLRTVEDARMLRACLEPGARLLIIGAGFVGQEAACAARRMGVEVTIVEAATAPLASTLGAQLGEWLTALHRSNGVRVLLEDQVVDVSGERTVHAVTLASGRELECDHVLVGVGVEPNLQWLAGTRLDATGVLTDPDGRTQLPDVFAAGDAAAAFDPWREEHVRGGHWETAARQGARAARAMLDLDTGAPAISSFWSDLYGIRIHYLGHTTPEDDVGFDGDPRSREFAATFTRYGQPVAVLLANRPQMLAHARALLTSATERMAA